MSKHYYLIELQYLGFRYHGWQKQPNVNTVQRMVDRTLNYVLGHSEFKTLISGRTDAMVSAHQTYFELFLHEPWDERELLRLLNVNLPTDIRVLSVATVDEKFNVIQNAKQKEYIYLFSYGEKNHPFSAPFMCCISDDLDIRLMKEGAKLFEGPHDFRNYCYKPSEHTQFERSILLSEIVVNDLFTANFFPERSFIYRVRGAGFMRHQVRMMMGALFMLGRGEISLKELLKSLDTDRLEPWNYIAPASGLMLHNVEYN